eukprot:CAMPEP_0194172890 /NCGR_PEP_ID=MMETSP0154-20130528/7291_1 /TAXON_ID=1049557 /ORGANISM="Thalassiothrix antarctica, Strain L6-D1" /LENGTH=165 /DNA_ID=CAMNT_0038885719 /DNA_START=85 /DNA_END=582 /DNA_ORIENTATION=-
MSEYIEGENLDITSANSDEDNEMTEEEKSKLRKGRKVKIIIGILLVAFIIYVIIDSTTTGYIRTGVTSFLEWCEANPILGFFICIDLGLAAVYFTYYYAKKELNRVVEARKAAIKEDLEDVSDVEALKAVNQAVNKNNDADQENGDVEPQQIAAEDSDEEFEMYC